jgi:hypothetical protein
MSTKITLEQRLAKLFSERALRLRIGVQEAAMPVQSAYLKALKEKADRLGISIEQVKDMHRPNYSGYPTPECLMPSELLDFMNDEPTEEVLRHISQCTPCMTLLEMSHPSEEGLNELLESVRIEASDRATHSKADLPQLFKVLA